MKSEQKLRMWTPTTVILLLLIFVGLAVALNRMLNGLGAVTNLSDRYPWGFWLGFDLLGGVAMAAGGFIIAVAVYLFNWEKYKPIARPAILTAFLGYLMASLAVFLDIGHPFRIWHPMVKWQIHSIMWVVSIHVVLYTTTLAVESSPMLFERLKWDNIRRAVEKIMLVAVVFGVMLSTLHQASLGAVFLIAPSKISPLWYTTMMPYLFLISAIAMGLCMVSAEAMFSTRAFRHKVDREIFFGLARGALVTLILYLVLKVFFLVKNAGIGAAFDGSLQANMFLLEMTIGVVIPVVLLAARSIRTNLNWIMSVNVLVITGVLVNRLNVCIFSMSDFGMVRGGGYFPAIQEFLLTLGIVSLGIFLFKLAAVHLPLFQEAEGSH